MPTRSGSSSRRSPRSSASPPGCSSSPSASASEEGGSIRIELPLSQEELAGATGASIESVGRALQTMRALKCIETRRREIRVLDRDALEALRRAAG